MAPSTRQKVVVVGAGPVGSLAALYAASRGDEVEVYELRGGTFIVCDKNAIPRRSRGAQRNPSFFFFFSEMKWMSGLDGTLEILRGGLFRKIPILYPCTSKSHRVLHYILIHQHSSSSPCSLFFYA